MLLLQDQAGISMLLLQDQEDSVCSTNKDLAVDGETNRLEDSKVTKVVSTKCHQEDLVVQEDLTNHLKVSKAKDTQDNLVLAVSKDSQVRQDNQVLVDLKIWVDHQDQVWVVSLFSPMDLELKILLVF